MFLGYKLFWVIYWYDYLLESNTKHWLTIYLTKHSIILEG